MAAVRFDPPRAGLALAGVCMLAGVLLPGVEIFGESTSAVRLALGGFAAPWLAMAVLGPVMVLAVLACRNQVACGGVGLLVGLGSLLIVGITWGRIGGIVWQVSRIGAHVFLAGAILSVLSSAALLWGEKTRWWPSRS